jgi:NADH pyrophosphatase NudC (nudix superfamily)
MRQVGSTNLVNVVRLYDPRLTFGFYQADRTDTYYVERGAETLLRRVPDMHTGQPESLADFLSFALEAYPSRRTLATTSDHGMAWEGLRALFTVLDDAHFALAGRAIQLLDWDRSHRYCGRCGTPTEAKTE